MWVVRTILIVLVIVFILAFGFYNNDSDNVVDVNDLNAVIVGWGDC